MPHLHFTNSTILFTLTLSIFTNLTPAAPLHHQDSDPQVIAALTQNQACQESAACIILHKTKDTPKLNLNIEFPIIRLTEIAAKLDPDPDPEPTTEGEKPLAEITDDEEEENEASESEIGDSNPPFPVPMWVGPAAKTRRDDGIVKVQEINEDLVSSGDGTQEIKKDSGSLRVVVQEGIITISESHGEKVEAFEKDTDPRMAELQEFVKEKLDSHKNDLPQKAKTLNGAMNRVFVQLLAVLTAACQGLLTYVIWVIAGSLVVVLVRIAVA